MDNRIHNPYGPPKSFLGEAGTTNPPAAVRVSAEVFDALVESGAIKSTDKPTPEQAIAWLKELPIPNDEDGNPITGAVLERFERSRATVIAEWEAQRMNPDTAAATSAAADIVHGATFGGTGPAPAAWKLQPVNPANVAAGEPGTRVPLVNTENLPGPEIEIPDGILRPELEAIIPERIKRLPVARGYPVPWFVAWIDGKPEFRVADGEKRVQALKGKTCWVCGEVLGAYRTLVIGPMCSVNRVTSEPPLHHECAVFSAKSCPFLTKPRMTRREAGLSEIPTVGPGGIMLSHNPGMTALWVVKQQTVRMKIDHGFHLFPDGDGKPLISLHDPERVEWYTEGRPATRAEVVAAIARGLPALERVCVDDDDRAALAKAAARVEAYYPAEAA